jgi:hypothetical protein
MSIIPVTAGQKRKSEWGHMARYDVFRMIDNAPVWIGTAETLEEANAQAKRHALEGNSECVVLDQATGHKIVINPGQDTRHLKHRNP